MKSYKVKLRVTTIETVSVSADNESDAELKAINGWSSGDLIDLDAYAEAITAISVESEGSSVVKGGEV